MDQGQLEALAEIVVEKDLLVLSDEVYEKLVYDTRHVSVLSLPELRDRTILVNSFSKTYAMTGWRVGYAIANQDITREMAKLNLYLNTCSTSFVQTAALEALQGPQDCVRSMVDQYKKRIDLMYGGLEKMKIPCVRPKGAFYLFPDFSQVRSSSYEMGMLLLEKAHVSTAAGIVFGQTGEGHLRFSCANSMENLRKALERIEKVLNDLRRG
jgi:aspartate/methionine/tyrosine aminotransferase